MFYPAVSLLAWLSVSLTTVTATAGTGSVQTRPTGAPSPRGLRITVDTRWVEGPGYRPVRVTVTAVGASASERAVTIRLHAEHWNQRWGTTTVEQQIVLPAGQTQATATVAMPRYFHWQQFSWDCLIAGRRVKELSRAAGGFTMTGNFDENDFTSRVLIVSDPTKPVRSIKHLVGFLPTFDVDAQHLVNASLWRRHWWKARDQSLAQFESQWATVITRPPSELPIRFVDYTCLDLVYVPLRELEPLVRQRPAAWQAILRWVAAGGNLVLEEPASLKMVEQTLAGPGEPAAGVWQATQGKLDWPTEFTLQNRYYAGRRTGPPAVDPGKTPAVKPLPTFRRAMQFGQVLAVGPGQAELAVELPEKPRPLDWKRFAWAKQHGLQPHVPHIEFWNFLIPGVGKPPVAEFGILITVFLVAVGPLSYFLLRRRGRLHVMLLSVPLAATGVTLGLLFYALLSDGLSVRYRMRSVTRLDQTTETAACWSRQLYYAGLAPAEGLSFPADTVLFPLLPTTQHDSYYQYRRAPQPTRHWVWRDRQHLVRGALPARQPTQYLTVSSRSATAKLEISLVGLPQVRNRLGVGVQKLLVCDESNSLYWAEQIGTGEQAKLTPIEFSTASERLHMEYEQARLGFPPELGGGEWPQTFGQAIQLDLTTLSAQELSLFLSPLEQGLRRIAKSSAASQQPLATRSYLAVVDRGLLVRPGVSGQDKGSLHLVIGRW